MQRLGGEFVCVLLEAVEASYLGILTQIKLKFFSQWSIIWGEVDAKSFVSVEEIWKCSNFKFLMSLFYLLLKLLQWGGIDNVLE